MSRNKTRISPLRFISSFCYRDSKFRDKRGLVQSPLFKLLKSGAGFTLIELTIFSAIFSLVSIIFVAMLVSITSVELRQTASSEVNRQSQFVMQTIQRYIEGSSLIETTSTPSQSLLLRMPTNSSGTNSLVNIYWETSTQSSAIYLQIGTSTPEAITSERIKVDDLTFKKFSRPNAHDSISFTLALSYNSSSTSKKFFQALTTSVGRVSAATFDSNIVPAAGLTDAALGVPGAPWSSINGLLFFEAGTENVYFSSENVKFGIGTYPPLHTLDVKGDGYFTGNVFGNAIKLNNAPLTPGCGGDQDVGYIRVYRTQAGHDEILVCVYYGNSHGWRAVSTTAPSP